MDWFPRLRAISLVVEDVDSEQNEWRTLYSQLEETNNIVKMLSGQLNELRDQMTETRKQKQRIGLLNNAPSLLNLGNNAAAANAANSGEITNNNNSIASSATTTTISSLT